MSEEEEGNRRRQRKGRVLGVIMASGHSVMCSFFQHRDLNQYLVHATTHILYHLVKPSENVLIRPITECNKHMPRKKKLYL